MQTALKPPPDTTLVPRLQRNAFHRRTLSPIPKPYKPPSLIIPSLSLRTSHEGTHRGEGQCQGQGPNTIRLPLVIRESGSISRYLWDGTDLHLVRVDGDAANHCFHSHDWFHELARFCATKLRNFFLPRQVERNYLEYVKWKFFHRVSSSALQVLATQAMFRAMGFGYSHSLSSAAALNWVLKDGLGRLCRCIYTASLASAFDTNLKMVRFSTSVLFTLSIGIELLTPCFPQCFLLLATIANIAKQISLACYLATGSAVHRTFAIADNLGEVSAKAQIQTVCFDNLGLLLAALLNMLCKNSQRLQAGLPFLVYPLFSAIDLFGIYQDLKRRQLETPQSPLDLNLQLPESTQTSSDLADLVLSYRKTLRFDALLCRLIRSRDDEEVRQASDATLNPLNINLISYLSSPIDTSMDRIEIIIDARIHLGFVPSPAEVSKEEGIGFQWKKGFLFSVHGKLQKGIKKEQFQWGILLCLREGAGTTDIIMGLLQACHIREELGNRIHWEHLQRGDDLSESFLKEWFEVLEDSQRRASDEVNLLKEEMCRAGWAVKSVLLNVQEQARYSFLVGGIGSLKEGSEFQSYKWSR
ncbi:hypothetical protein Syun_004941 [Stephania yunnanensis]|uniref:Protein root UVB sensitive 4 n=1 Tax=Stephania yunnanensis TaxID=152371 RepID=A0AAP0L827_9MAGN